MALKDKKKNKEYHKNYYLKNRDKFLVREKKRYGDNPENKKEYSKIYFTKNREKVLVKSKEYRIKNKVKYRAAIDKWMLEHKEEYKNWRKKWMKEYVKKNRAIIYARDVKRRELKRNSIDETTDMEKIKQFYILSETLSEQMGVKYVVDHIIPISKGGRHHQDNLQVITMIDNLKKGSKYPFEVIDKHFPNEIFFNPEKTIVIHT